MKKIFFFLFTLPFFLEASIAQKINWQPTWILSNDNQPSSVTLFAKETNQLLHFRNNKVWLYSTDGKQIGEPIIVRKDNGDIQFPRISTSGKNISFYQQSDDFLKDGAMKMFNIDSNRIVGSYKVPYNSELIRVRFSGDSIMQYFTHLPDINNLFRWNLNRGYVNTLNFFEDSVHSGIYDIVNIDDKVFMTARNADTLVITSFDIDSTKGMDIRKIPLAAKNTDLKAEFSAGFPYLFVSDQSKDSTDLYGFAEGKIVKLRRYKGIYHVYAAMGDLKKCKAVVKNQNGDFFIMDVDQDELQYLSFLPKNDNKIFDIDLNRNLLFISHPTNGQISAYNIEDQKLQWDLTPAPGREPEAKSDMALPVEDAFYKVMIKQGGSSVYNWKYDKDNDHLFLIRDNSKLVTIDASSECVLKTEIFNDENFLSSKAILLPGFRYVSYQQETWRKDETNSRTNVLGETEKFEGGCWHSSRWFMV